MSEVRVLILPKCMTTALSSSISCLAIDISTQVLRQKPRASLHRAVMLVLPNPAVFLKCLHLPVSHALTLAMVMFPARLKLRVGASAPRLLRVVFELRS